MMIQPNNGEKQYLIQKNQEKQLTTLIREYFVLEKAASHLRLSEGTLLAKGDRVIDIFLKEHANILDDLSRAAAPGRISDDNKLFEKLSNLIDQNSSFQDKVNTHQNYLKELDLQTREVEKDVQLLRNQQVTDRQCEERIWNAFKLIEKVENKLETQMRQFGTICTKNKELRTEIDHLLWQRELFMDQWNGLIDRLCEGKKIMLDLIEQATIAYNQKEEWCTKLQMLRLKANQEWHSNSHQLREEKRKMDHNEKLRDFIWIKEHKRILKDLKARRQEKRRVMEMRMKDKYDAYVDIMNDVERFTETKSLKQIASSFTKQEEYNLSNFKCVIELIKEIEDMSDQLGYQLLRIDEETNLIDNRRLGQKKTLEDLLQELEKTDSEADEAENQLKNTEFLLKRLLAGTSTLFTLCQCDKDPLLKLLGDNTNVDVHNVHLYLQILERTIQEVLVSAGYQDMVKKPETKRIIEGKSEIKRIYHIESIVKVTPCSLCLEHEMVSDVIDTLQYVCSKSETKTRLNYRLSLPEGKSTLHTNSHCQLPKARSIMQKRYE